MSGEQGMVYLLSGLAGIGSAYFRQCCSLEQSWWAVSDEPNVVVLF